MDETRRRRFARAATVCTAGAAADKLRAGQQRLLDEAAARN